MKMIRYHRKPRRPAKEVLFGGRLLLQRALTEGRNRHSLLESRHLHEGNTCFKPRSLGGISKSIRCWMRRWWYPEQSEVRGTHTQYWSARNWQWPVQSPLVTYYRYHIVICSESMCHWFSMEAKCFTRRITVTPLCVSCITIKSSPWFPIAIENTAFWPERLWNDEVLWDRPHQV